MLHQYIYKPSDAGLDAWPSGELRLEGIEITEDASKADVFVLPGNLRIFEKSSGVLDIDRLNRLPHFKGNESKFVAFDVSDNFTQPVNLPIIFIRCDVRTWMLPHDPNTIQMAWPVEDYSECIDLPEGGFKYDVSFQGWLSSDARILSVNSCKENSRLTCDLAEYSDFSGYRKPEDPEYTRRRAEFRRSMKESRIALCGESIPGVLPYRFFEAMSAGRVPLLVGSNYVLPMADLIPYDEFILRCETANASDAGRIIEKYVGMFSDAMIRETGLEGRRYWEKYLDSRKWPQLMAYAVQKKLGVLQSA